MRCYGSVCASRTHGSGTGVVAWSHRGGLPVKFDIGAPGLALDAFCARIGPITRKTGLDALIASLFGGGCPRSRGGAPATGTGGGKRLFVCVALVAMAGKQIASSKLITAVQTLVGAVAGVGSHVAGNMLGPGEGGLADGTSVVAAHLFW